MPLSYFRSDRAVNERIQRAEIARAYRANASASITEDFTTRLDALYQAYPHMAAGELIALAKAGVSPTDPVVQQIADVSFEQKRKSGAFDRIGDFLGGARNVAGAVLSPVGNVLDEGLGEIDETLSPTLKGAARTGFVVMETPLQELQTFIRAGGWAGVRLAENQGDTSILNKVRNLVDPSRWDDMAETFSEAYADAGSSSGREVVSALLRGDDVGLGSGFLPAGEVEDVVRERSNRLTLRVGDAQFGGPGNPSISVGRVAAARVFEPGETAFNVVSGLIDGGVAWFGDPAAAVGGAARTARVGSRVGRAGRAFVDEGLAAAGRELAHSGAFAPVVDRSLQSRAAGGLGDLLDSITGRVSSSPRKTVQPDLVDGWLTKGGQRLVERIAETTDFYELWQATGKKIPVEMTVRLADAASPQQVMDILRPALGTQLREAPEFLGFRVRRANGHGVRLLGDMPGAFLDPSDLDGAVGQLDAWLRNAKVDPAIRNRAVETIARNPSRQTMVAAMDDIMDDVADDLATRIKGRAGETPTVRARGLTRLFNRDVEKARTYFGDEIAENRKAVGVNVGGTVIEAQSPFLFTEYLNSVIPLPDARELRRATSRLSRLVDNPFFERTAGAIDALQGAWKKATLLRGAYTVRVIGEEQLRMAASGGDSLFAHPISAIAALTADERSISRFIGTGRRRQVDVLGDDFFDGAEAATEELRAALNTGWAGWVDDTVFDRSFTLFRPGDDGYKRAWRDALGELHRDPVARKVAEANGNLTDVKDWFFRRQGRKFRKAMVESHPQLATQVGSDRYIDDLWEGVQYRTGSDPVLMQAVATGKIGDARIGHVNGAGRYTFSRELDEHLDTVVGPETVKGQRILKQGENAGIGEVWDNATGWAFSHLMTKPTNWLSRSQTFRQRYWERIEEMLPYMDDATRVKAVARAEGVVDAAQLRRMRQTAGAVDQTVTDLSDADFLAKAYALDETKKLLYDLTERGQFFDTFRLLFPFGEAWREVLTRWAKIGVENPRVLRRGQQVITGARGNGFFHKDVNGEEVFTYPFSRQISKALIGMPIDLNGRVAGLSLMTEVLPGVGPVVQMPAAAILPETPDWDWARRIISPYGEADYSGGILEAMLPGYARNIMQFFEAGDERLFANTVGATMDYLASTGDYDLSNPDDVRRLTDEARELARGAYLLRGLTQFGAPTSPAPEFLIEDKDGDLEVARVVLQDFYEMQDRDYDSAVGEFLDRYGRDVFLLTQGKSFSIPPKLPVTKASSDWERANGDIVKDHPGVWGFFAPAGDTEDFDYQAYVRQFERGERVTLTPEQRTSLAQARVGRYIYEKAKAKVSERPSAQERDWLAAVKERIREEYPGYGEMTAGLPARASTEQIVADLTRAINDPRLAGTRQAEAARLYIEARQRALAYAHEVGVKTLEAQAAAPAREWLAAAAGRIVVRYPEFREMFDVVFAREVGL